MNIGVILASAIPSILSAVVLLVINRQQKKAEERAKDREEREELILEGLNANFCVTKELVDCTLYGKHPNGELEEAYKYKQNIKHKIENYERSRAARS